jgi:Uncharacterized conserved protein
MSIERVREYFANEEIYNKIMEFEVSSATVELAAQAIGCEPERIAKSMAFKTDDGCILVIIAGDAKIANPKYKERFGVKAKMVPADELEELIGHAIGGVCPFGINEDVKVYLDESLKRFETVFPACGSANSAMEMTLPELEKYAKTTKWVDVCKDW